jgi:hypothetical protein
MELATVTDAIRSARAASTIEPWQGYRIQEVPFAIYDDTAVDYIGHPSPPQERPSNLMAATAISINEVMTATVPVVFCTDEPKAVTIAYHEGFHVFQHHHFAPLTADMFTAMAFYPDLDLEYRTLCRLETDILNNEDWSAEQKLGFFSYVLTQRREKIAQHPALLPYERLLERSEGTAYYVEQKVWQALYGVTPTSGETGFGWSRFYNVGAALCRLLDATLPDWMRRVEEGASPGDLVMAWGAEQATGSINLEALDYQTAREIEAAALQNFKNEIAPALNHLENAEVIRIRYGNQKKASRAFTPITLVSLGDGRILHRTSFKLLLPGRGSITVTQTPVIDNIADSEIILNAADVSLELVEGTLRANTPKIQVDIANVEAAENGVFVLNAQ